MYFNKYPHVANFAFAEKYEATRSAFDIGSRKFSLQVDSYGSGIHRLQVLHPDTWSPNHCLTQLCPPEGTGNGLTISPDFQIAIQNSKGETVLQSRAGATFGVCADQWVIRFEVDPETRYYGLGEKNFGRLELSGLRTKFWNTDVWGDFHYTHWADQPVDPPYISIPYVILKRANGYVGILLHTGFPTFMEIPGDDASRAFEAWRHTSPQIILGAEGGHPDIWILEAPTLRELTQKYQKLIGVTPTPPLWSLGYHQCRWGYEGEAHLVDLDVNFEKHQFPCDGLWLDIDYMRGYRVFTTEEKHFPKGVGHTIGLMKKNDRKVVPILDPGVKFEKGFEVYEDGHKKDVVCWNRQGGEYVGIVWPGETVFPDFSLQEGRDWWAGYCAKFMQSGFRAAWVDMNDPSTGPVDPTGMLFNRGTQPHEKYHNQYALGMQMATFQGFLQAKPNERPFILTRSGFVGTAKYSAAWTGDNVSNYFYLKASVPTSLNLALSGIPFNGPDVGGFGDEPSDGLMLDWVKTCFLFPFMRNHTGDGSKRGQEPWKFKAETLEQIRKYVRLRYKFLPYLYNLFIDQEELGDPPMRPLLYEFEGQADLETVSQQFMIGPSILQAPVVDEKKRSVSAILPGKGPWLDANSGKWKKKSVTVKPAFGETALYFRNGSVVPMQKGIATTNTKDISNVDVLLAFAPGTTGETSYAYRSDDGLSYGYRDGERSCLQISASWKGKALSISSQHVENGFGAIQAEFLVPAGFEKIEVDGRPGIISEEALELTGAPLAFVRVR